jgi:acid stress-induced BolA-like protein IbaG/YrbA
LASVQTQPAHFWEHQAARLRDAQAGALDTRVRGLSAIPNATPDWPERLLAELGKIALLTHAFRQEEQLEPGMREEVRQLIGWSLNQEEVNARGETVRDDWLVVGQVVEDTERGRTQRTWLSGLNSGYTAMILQFSFAGQPFSEQFVIGGHQEANLTYWPGTYPQRAQVRARVGEIASFQGTWPGVTSLDEFLDGVASALGSLPWLEHTLAQLREVTPICSADGTSWFVRDSAGCTLPLAGRDHWLLLALSGGRPLHLVGEWSNGELRPLGVAVDGQFTPLGREH